MAMTAEERRRCWAQMMRLQAWPVNKVDLRAAVDAVDDWCDSAATSVPSVSFNAALPLAFRTTASPSQKALILAYVCERRAGVFRAEEDG
jgi:hypothetical protein